MKQIVNRFFRYIAIDTQGNEQGYLCPSNENQRLLAELLQDELQEMGISQVEVDEKGFLYAMIPANTAAAVPKLALLAHLDTNPRVLGENIKPRIVSNYDGSDILLNESKNMLLSPKQFPRLSEYIGQDLIVTDGTTLLGADGKAGITEIMEAVRYLCEHSTIKHGDIYLCFTPDEELGYSTEYISLDKIPADFGFTVHGGGLGEINIENFNAATATITVSGYGVHPGVARNTMKNAVLLAHKFISCLPEQETPETTDAFQGYYHISDIRGSVEKCIMTCHIRDFDQEQYEFRKNTLRQTAAMLNQMVGEGTFEVSLEDYYFNMKPKIQSKPYILQTAQQAMKMAGVQPRLVPIRGGTDGAVISFRGFPCPNIFSGEENGFSVFEYISVQSMEKSVEVITNIIQLVAQLDSEL